MYLVTNNESFLEFAQDTAKWYENNKFEENGVFWKTKRISTSTSYSNYTIYKFGSAGAGIFLINLYSATGNLNYLYLSENVTRSLLNEANQSIGYHWPVLYKTTGNYITSQRAGTSGIGKYFLNFSDGKSSFPFKASQKRL